MNANFPHVTLMRLGFYYSVYHFYPAAAAANFAFAACKEFYLASTLSFLSLMLKMSYNRIRSTTAIKVFLTAERDALEVFYVNGKVEKIPIIGLEESKFLEKQQIVYFKDHQGKLAFSLYFRNVCFCDPHLLFAISRKTVNRI